jgi:hypothetical protein
MDVYYDRGFLGLAHPCQLATACVLTWASGLLLMGHVYMIILVMLCQTLVYREVTALFSLKDVAPDAADIAAKGRRDPWSKTLNWYFFAVTNYFLYGESIIYYFKASFARVRCNLALIVLYSTWFSLMDNSSHLRQTIVSSVSCYTRLVSWVS